jgi:hypothetical protein
LGGEQRGFDNHKKVKGRKRHISAVAGAVVEALVTALTMGLLLAISVHAAHQHESKTALKVLKKLYKRFPRLKVIFADQAYQGSLAVEVEDH